MFELVIEFLFVGILKNGNFKWWKFDYIFNIKYGVCVMNF